MSVPGGHEPHEILNITHNGPVEVTIDLLHLAEDSEDGIAVFDSLGSYLYVNGTMERLLQLPRAEILGHTVYDVSPTLTKITKPFAHFFALTAEGRSPSFLEAFAPAIGRWLQIRLIPCAAHRTISRDERGVTVYFRDVTTRIQADQERKQIVRERAESEGRFRALSDVAPVLIWTSGTDGGYDWFNQPWLNFAGRSHEQEVGYGWMENVHPDDLDHCIATYRAAFDLRQPCRREYRLRRYDGEYRWMLDNGIPRYSTPDSDDSENATQKTFLGYIGSCVDISDRKLAEESRERAIQEREEALGEVARLYAASAELMRQQTELLNQQRAFLRDVLSAVTDGVMHLCDGSENLPDAIPTGNDTVPLNAASTLRQLRRTTEQIATDCELPEDRISDLLTAVSEAAMNVVTHAGGRGIGRVGCDSKRGCVQVWVTDSGPGIPMDTLHRSVLERGFTTAGTLGHGFWLMLRTADRIYLLTSDEGTTVVIEKGRTTPEPEWAERQAGIV